MKRRFLISLLFEKKKKENKKLPLHLPQPLDKTEYPHGYFHPKQPRRIRRGDLNLV